MAWQPRGATTNPKKILQDGHGGQNMWSSTDAITAAQLECGSSVFYKTLRWYSQIGAHYAQTVTHRPLIKQPQHHQWSSEPVWRRIIRNS